MNANLAYEFDSEEDPNIIFRQACRDGKVNICEELCKTWIFDDDFDFLNECFELAFIYEHLGMAKWLKKRFVLTAICLTPKTLHYCFFTACNRGNVDLARWFFRKFGKCQNIHACLLSAFQYKRTNIVRFLFEEVGLGADDIKELEVDELSYPLETELDSLRQACDEHSNIGQFTKAVKIK